MKVVYVITEGNENILRIGPALSKMGHEGHMVMLRPFHATCSYWEHKLDKWGFHARQEAYVGRQVEEIIEVIEAEKPQAVIFVNSHCIKQLKKYLLGLAKEIRVACWYVDGVSGKQKELALMVGSGINVFCYEPLDIPFFTHGGVKSQYLPVGYNDAYEDASLAPLREKEAAFDISFIGSPTGDRVQFLEALAEFGAQRHWRMRFIGPFAEKKYFWKEFVFSTKHPVLVKFVENGFVSPAEAARVYARSKICLNIQGTTGENINPRTFEIMAAGGFELMSRHKNYRGLIEPGRDFVDFATPEELCRKAEYYLTHDEERRSIAQNGRERVKGRFSMQNSLRVILSDAGV